MTGAYLVSLVYPRRRGQGQAHLQGEHVQDHRQNLPLNPLVQGNGHTCAERRIKVLLPAPVSMSNSVSHSLEW